MPLPRKRCIHCRNFLPCQTHPQGWAASKSPRLPGNWRSLCKAVRARDRGCCRHCGRPALPGEVDHIVPRAIGGLNELSNLQLLCTGCHRIKTYLDRRKR